ncbi:MAG: hypothetical protein K2O06_05230 [Acetatifactor sp.]|nr:hypothetical protein [Acetatifactor sp.]
MNTTYQIMHGDKVIASIDTRGHCRIYAPVFMPYGLVLDDSAADLDSLVARLALSYRCVSLTDIFWIKSAEEDISFSAVNLFENHLENAFVDVSLRGRQMTVTNRCLERDLSTNGLFPKAWLRTDHGFLLLKDGGRASVENELLASKICQCFQCSQVVYEEKVYDGEKVSASSLMTSLEHSIVSREAYEIYAANHDQNALEDVLQLDAYSFYMMNILDYLTGNTDRHWGNWGFLVDNRTNRPISLHPLMDFNQTFQAYDRLEGANCQTVFPLRATQQEAAVTAVSQIGLNQLREVDEAWFCGDRKKSEMFFHRLDTLKKKL